MYDNNGNSISHEPSREELQSRLTELQQKVEFLNNYKNIFSSTKDGVAFIDKEYRYVIVNATYEKFFGVNRREFPGRTVAEYLGSDVFETVVKKKFDRCLQGQTINFQQWLVFPTLGRRFMDLSYFPYRDGNEAIAGIIVNSRDITEKYYYEAEQDLMDKLLQIIQKTSESRVLADDAAALMQECSQCEAVAVRLEEEGEFPCSAARGFSFTFAEALNRHCPVAIVDRDGRSELAISGAGCLLSGGLGEETTSIGVHVTENGSFWTNSTSELTACFTSRKPALQCQHCWQGGYESVAKIPLRAGRRIMGVLQFNDRRRQMFDERIIGQLERMAANLAIAFLQRDTDTHLRESEQRFRLMINNLPGTAYQFVLTNQGEQTFTFMSEGCRELFGFSSEEILADPSQVFSCVPEEEGGKIEEAIYLSAKTFSTYDMEHRILDSSGREKWVRAISTPRRLADGAVAWDGIAIDISARKAVEGTLRQSYEDILLRKQISKRFLTSKDGELYADILDILLKRFSSQNGYIGYIDEDGSLVCPSLTRSIWEKCQMPEKSIRFPPSCWGGVWGESLKKRKSIVCNAGLQVPAQHVPVRNVLVVPLLAEKNLIGQIALANTSDGYGEEDKRQLESLAGFIAPVLQIYLEKEKVYQELQTSLQRLEQTNIALKVVLENGKDVRQEISDAIRKNFATLVTPHFDTITASLRKEELLTIVDIIRKNIDTSLNSLEPTSQEQLQRFSPQEIKVVHLIKAGKTSKEIANILNISTRSVFFHRNNLRRKLNIQNSGKSLKTTLLQMEI